MKRILRRDRIGPAGASRLLFGNVAEIHDLTVTELAAAIRVGRLSPVEITEHYLQRIERLNEQVGAFYTVTPELARDQAAVAEKAVATELRGGGGGLAALPPLTGIPIPIKDLNMVAGVRLTYGCTLFADNVAAEDDYVVAALRAAGTVMTGKTAAPEFGLPCYTETRIGPPARTPWGPEQVSRGIQRRRGSGGRGRPGASSAGERRRRLDPDPVQRLRAVRDQADPRPDLRRAAHA
jgi:amidase